MISQNLSSYLETVHNHSRTRKPGFKDLPEDSTGRLLRRQKSPRAVVRGVFSLVLYPNGEFGLGRLKNAQKSTEDKRQERNQVAEFQFAMVSRPIQLEDGRTLHDSTDKIWLPTKLGSSNELSQAKRKYGRKGITGYGRRMVRNCAYVMEKSLRYKNKLQMGTLTIPSLPEEQMLIICENWAYLVKRFYEQCKRRYEQRGLNWDYVSVTEIQPKRWETRHEVGLHLHFLFVSHWIDEDREWSLPDNWVRETWKRTLCGVLGTSDGMPTPNYRRECVRVSAAGYMAKYMSKGAEQIQAVIDEKGEEWLPSQWWSASLSLRRCVKAACLRTTGEIAEMILDVCEKRLEGWLHYVSDVCINMSAHTKPPYSVYELRVGWRGRLTEWAMEYIGMPREDLYYALTLDKYHAN